MGLFSSIFGGSKKVDYSRMVPDPPKFNLAQGSQEGYVGGLQDLINVFNRRSQGEDQFDYLSYVYGPQANELRQNYGIDTNQGDIYSQRTGALPQTLASLNKRGLLDTGTSGIIEGQLRSNLANELARAYGGAKTMQRGDIDNSLQALSSLFPQRFQAENIGSQIDYDNAMNGYQALLQRNALTQQQSDQNRARKEDAWNQGIELAMAAVGGGLGGAGMLGAGSQIGAGGMAGAGQGALQSLFGRSPYGQQQNQSQYQYNPNTSSNRQGYGYSVPGNQGSFLLGSMNRGGGVDF